MPRCDNCSQSGHTFRDCPSRACQTCGESTHRDYECLARVTPVTPTHNNFQKWTDIFVSSTRWPIWGVARGASVQVISPKIVLRQESVHFVALQIIQVPNVLPLGRFPPYPLSSYSDISIAMCATRGGSTRFLALLWVRYLLFRRWWSSCFASFAILFCLRFCGE
jgi:hypothetical protein